MLCQFMRTSYQDAARLHAPAEDCASLRPMNTRWWRHGNPHSRCCQAAGGERAGAPSVSQSAAACADLNTTMSRRAFSTKFSEPCSVPL